MEQRFRLRRGELLAVQGAAIKAEVAGGGAWITQHGDIEDYFVRDGTWASRSEGLIVIQALLDCRVVLLGHAAAKPQLRRSGAPEPSAPRRWFAFA